MATLETFIVVSSLPIVIEDAGVGISYSPGAIFRALSSNESVRRLLDQGKIARSATGTAESPGFTIVVGPRGPTGPSGTGNGLAPVLAVDNETGGNDLVITDGDVLRSLDGPVGSDLIIRAGAASGDQLSGGDLHLRSGTTINGDKGDIFISVGETVILEIWENGVVHFRGGGEIRFTNANNNSVVLQSISLGYDFGISALVGPSFKAGVINDASTPSGYARFFSISGELAFGEPIQTGSSLNPVTFSGGSIYQSNNADYLNIFGGTDGLILGGDHDDHGQHTIKILPDKSMRVISEGWIEFGEAGPYIWHPVGYPNVMELFAADRIWCSSPEFNVNGTIRMDSSSVYLRGSTLYPGFGIEFSGSGGPALTVDEENNPRVTIPNLLMTGGRIRFGAGGGYIDWNDDADYLWHDGADIELVSASDLKLTSDSVVVAGTLRGTDGTDPTPLTLRAGNSTDSGYGADVLINGGSSLAYGGNIRLTSGGGDGGEFGIDGSIYLDAGPVSGAVFKGDIYLRATRVYLEQAFGSGPVVITGKLVSFPDPGVDVNITGGSSSGYRGGSVIISGADGGSSDPGSEDGGDVRLKGGNGVNGINYGEVQILDPTGGLQWTFNLGGLVAEANNMNLTLSPTGDIVITDVLTIGAAMGGIDLGSRSLTFGASLGDQTTGIYFDSDGIQLWGEEFDFDVLFLEGAVRADPVAPAAGRGRLYFRDTGGKVELVARFPTGAIKQIAIED